MPGLRFSGEMIALATSRICDVVRVLAENNASSYLREDHIEIYGRVTEEGTHSVTSTPIGDIANGKKYGAGRHELYLRVFTCDKVSIEPDLRTILKPFMSENQRVALLVAMAGLSK